MGVRLPHVSVATQFSFVCRINPSHFSSFLSWGGVTLCLPFEWKLSVLQPRRYQDPKKTQCFSKLLHTLRVFSLLSSLSHSLPACLNIASSPTFLFSFHLTFCGAGSETQAPHSKGKCPTTKLDFSSKVSLLNCKICNTVRHCMPLCGPSYLRS